MDHETEGLWIDGRRVPAASGQKTDVHNPATGEVLASVAQAGPEDVNAAVAAARRAWERGDWRRASTSERARVLL
jgi:acyl-CoA reductase-like NAD-dependent aldehyde dehydrogenase